MYTTTLNTTLNTYIHENHKVKKQFIPLYFRSVTFSTTTNNKCIKKITNFIVCTIHLKQGKDSITKRSNH